MYKQLYTKIILTAIVKVFFLCTEKSRFYNIELLPNIFTNKEFILMNSLDAQTNILMNLDSLILGLPTAVFTGLATGASLLEESDNGVVSKIGTIGRHTCVFLGQLCAIPLLVLNSVKAIFANFLNEITFREFKPLRFYANYTKEAFDMSKDLIFDINKAIDHMPTIFSPAESY